ncbi:MAG: hypothetical protein ACYC6A_16670 [Armatimonadota bacterium]
MASNAIPTDARPSGNAGIIVLVLVLVILLIAVFYPMFVRHGEPPRPACQSNVRQLMVAIQMHMQDHANTFPANDAIWRDVPFPPRALSCPENGVNRGNGYGYNAHLSGRSPSESGMPNAAALPVLADSKVPTHLLHTRTDIDPRHDGAAYVGFADGHVELLPLTGIPTLQPKNPPTEENHP